MKINSNSIRKLIIIHLFLSFLFMLWWSVLKLPWYVTYIFDILLCIEFAWVLMDIRPVLHKTGATPLIPILIVFTFYLLLTQIFNFVSPLLSVMAFRRTFRFYLFFLACVVMLTKDGVRKIMKGLLWLQVVNFGLTIIQYMFLGYSQDNLGGIFGVEKGVNAYTNVYLCIISAYMLVRYLEKKTKLWPMLLTIVSALIIAVLAELKVFFVEIIVIVLLGILLSNPSARTIKTIAFAGGGIVAAVALFGIIFPEHFEILLNMAMLAQYTTEKIHGYNISRLNAFSDINRLFFKNDPLLNLFGYGFGNCESGSVFYERYSDYHYSWFTHQVSFLEIGYVGIVLYMLFFVFIYVFSGKSKKQNPENRLYYSFAQIVSVMSMIWVFYDQSLRIELAYIIFFALAVPLVVKKSGKKGCTLQSDRESNDACR